MGEHIAHAELSLFAHDKLAVERERREEIESHVANCAECGATLDFYSVAEEDLGDLVLHSLNSRTGVILAETFAREGGCEVDDAISD